MTSDELVESVEKFVRSRLAGESSGHDWRHIHQVRKNALAIAEGEKDVDLIVVELAALLHDIADSKMHGGDHSIGPRVASGFLSQFDLPQEKIDHICQIIRDQSFSAKSGKLPTLEGRIVQDADRLEAMGAIGVARCFAYGGKKGQPIYDPDASDGKHSVQHFYDKLLKLKDLMNTKAGKRLAEERHRFMESFLEEFFNEWG